MDAISNAVARLTASPPASVSRQDLSGAEDIAYLNSKLAERERQYAALLDLHERMKQDMGNQVAAARAECETMRSQRDTAEKMCAEYKGRVEGATPAPVSDNVSKYESLVADYTDLRVLHGSCAAKEEGLRQLNAELRKQNDNLQAQIQACLVEDEEPEETSEEKMEGCEIDVIRGGDDRVRSYKVRYV